VKRTHIFTHLKTLNTQSLPTGNCVLKIIIDLGNGFSSPVVISTLKIYNQLYWSFRTLKGYSTFLEIGSFYNSPRVKQFKQFYRFLIHSDDFLIFRRILVTRQFLVSLTSIVGKKYILYGIQ